MAAARTKLTEEEKAFRRHQRKAAALNAKAVAEAGMFADVPGEVQLVTADELAERRRRMQVDNVDGTANGSVRYKHTWNRPLEDIKLRLIHGIARALLGEWFKPLYDYAERTYPPWFGSQGGHGYHIDFWKDRLSTSKPCVYQWVLMFDAARVNAFNSDGRYLVAGKQFPPDGWAPPLTPEQIDELVPTIDRREEPLEYDDGGLFERVMSRVRQGATA